MLTGPMLCTNIYKPTITQLQAIVSKQYEKHTIPISTRAINLKVKLLTKGWNLYENHWPSLIFTIRTDDQEHILGFPAKQPRGAKEHVRIQVTGVLFHET